MMVEYLKIKWLDINEKEAEKLLREGLAGDFIFRASKIRNAPLSEIRIIADTQAIETLSHELGHFIQSILAQSGIPFDNEEEVSLLLEDTIRKLIRKKLYKVR
jgi:hypothetical protein